MADKDPDKLLTLSEQLYSTLDDAQLLGKNCKRRSLILKTVFKLLDLYAPRLLLKLARLILAVSASTRRGCCSNSRGSSSL